MATNDFSNKVSLLAELWMNYREEQQLADFIAYNDLGLPLAYFIHNELVTPTNQAEMYIDETYALLLASLEIEDDTYESLDQLLEASNEQDEE